MLLLKKFLLPGYTVNWWWWSQACGNCRTWDNWNITICGGWIPCKDYYINCSLMEHEQTLVLSWRTSITTVISWILIACSGHMKYGLASSSLPLCCIFASPCPPLNDQVHLDIIEGAYTIYNYVILQGIRNCSDAETCRNVFFMFSYLLGLVLLFLFSDCLNQRDPCLFSKKGNHV